MPNWCEGVLKIRGKDEDIRRFLKRGIEPQAKLNCNREEPYIYPKPEIEEDKYSLWIKSNSFGFYIKNTRRHFIEDEDILYENFSEEGEEKIVCVNFQAAWGIDTYALADISGEYNIDFKIYAFERGMCFNQDIEIIKGKVIKDDEIKFDDYVWECINPTMGG